MHYRLTITCIVANPDYETEKAKFEESRRFGRSTYSDNDGPRATLEEQMLYTVVNEEQFNAIRKAALEKMP